MKMDEATLSYKNIERIRSIQHSNFLDYLSCAYEVLRKIFSYLSLEDLEIVRKAFEKWKPIVETTIKERNKIESFVMTRSTNQTFDMWSESLFSITFCLNKNKGVEKKFKKHLKENAKFLMIKSKSGIIGTPSDLSGLFEEKKKYQVPSTSAVHLRIPSFPGFGVKIFDWKADITFENFKNSFSLPKNQIIKCLLILASGEMHSSESGVSQKDEFISHLLSTQSESFAIGGCFIDEFLEDSQKSSEVITKYIVFYGDNFEASSTVLDENTSTKESIDQAVEELKLISPKTNKGVLFVFRCCQRNFVSRHGKLITEWERESVAKYFPNTNIIGCLGYGEYGMKFPTNENFEPAKKRMKEGWNTWEHSFSTSLVYIGFKNK